MARIFLECPLWLIKLKFILEGFKMIKNALALLFILFFISGCSWDPDSPENRQDLSPTTAHDCILDGSCPKLIEGESSPKNFKMSDFFKRNKEGDIPLGLAIKQGKVESALYVLDKVYQCKHLYHPNHKKESFIYLAAKAGYKSIIQAIGNKCYQKKEEDPKILFYDFSKLDLEAETGDKALHVAANSNIAEALKYEYDRSTAIGSPFRFYYHINHKGQNYLHRAVEDSRLDMIRWAVKEECDTSSTQKDSGYLQSAWDTVKDWGTTSSQTIQTYTATSPTDFINEKDNEGNAPLHLAAKALNAEAIRILSSCWRTDYFLEDGEENIPLQVLLSHITPSSLSHTNELKESFQILARNKTQVRWWTGTADLINHQNQNTDSSLHIAARLADPYFYNYLKQFGNIYLENASGETPESLFNANQRKLKNSGHEGS